MPDTITVAYIAGISMVVGGVIAKGFDFFLARLAAHNQKPITDATAEEKQAQANAVIAENYLRSITRIDADNKRLQDHLDAYESRITQLETGRKQDARMIEALDNTVRRQSAQIRVLTDMVLGLGGTPPPFEGVNGKI